MYGRVVADYNPEAEMKIVRYEANGASAYGVLQDDDSIRELIGSPFEDFSVGDTVADFESVRVLPPVEPRKVIGVGLNYIKHIEEVGMTKPPFPMLFMKPNTGVIGHGDAIVFPKEGVQTEYECELTVVIGKDARRVSEDEALDCVLGYTCGNDVSERTIQLPEMKMGAMLIGKGFDTFCPIGPVIATGIDPSDLQIQTRLNGETRQDDRTSDLLFSVPKLVSYISDAMTLQPGDCILTGTPSGVGPIAPGDVVEIDIEGVGVLRNPVVAEG